MRRYFDFGAGRFGFGGAGVVEMKIKEMRD
jgi:hypothetical protein